MSKMEIYDVECTAETKKAILCLIEGEEFWIPQSQIDDDSEVYQKGQSGTLIITEWFAKKEGLWEE